LRRPVYSHGAFSYPYFTIPEHHGKRNTAIILIHDLFQSAACVAAGSGIIRGLKNTPQPLRNLTENQQPTLIIADHYVLNTLLYFQTFSYHGLYFFIGREGLFLLFFGLCLFSRQFQF